MWKVGASIYLTVCGLPTFDESSQGVHVLAFIISNQYIPNAEPQFSETSQRSTYSSCCRGWDIWPIWSEGASWSLHMQTRLHTAGFAHGLAGLWSVGRSRCSGALGHPRRCNRVNPEIHGPTPSWLKGKTRSKWTLAIGGKTGDGG